MKYCPNCGTQLHDDVTGCPGCGGRWDGTGAFAPPPEAPAPPAHANPQGAPQRTLQTMSPAELRREIRWGVFQGQLIVMAVVLGVYLVIFLLIAGCANATVHVG